LIFSNKLILYLVNKCTLLMAQQIIQFTMGLLCNMGNLKYIFAPLALCVPCNVLNCMLCMVIFLPIYFTPVSRFNSKDQRNKNFNVAFGWTCLFYLIAGTILWELVAIVGCKVNSRSLSGKLGSLSGSAVSSMKS
jgi:hypothetical protein